MEEPASWLSICCPPSEAEDWLPVFAMEPGSWGPETEMCPHTNGGKAGKCPHLVAKAGKVSTLSRTVAADTNLPRFYQVTPHHVLAGTCAGLPCSMDI